MCNKEQGFYQSSVVSELDQLRAELASKEQQLATSQAENLLRQWQPIETAPKDETTVILYGPRKMIDGIAPIYPDVPASVFAARFFAGMWQTGGPYKPAPTHWMPFPSAPDATPPGDQSTLREVIARVLEEAELQRYSPYLLAQKLRSGEWTPEVLR